MQNQIPMMIPLKQWEDIRDIDPLRSGQLNGHGAVNRKASVFRKVTVAYTVLCLLRNLADTGYAIHEIERIFSIDNLIVECSGQSDIGCEVIGLRVISPPLTCRLEYHPAAHSSAAANGLARDCMIGKRVKSFVLPTASQNQKKDNDSPDERILCRLLGEIIYTFLSGNKSLQRSAVSQDISDLSIHQPQSKKKIIDTSTNEHVVQLHQLGYPRAFSDVVDNLLDSQPDLFCSDDSYQSQQDIIDDLQMLLEEPERFLFDQYPSEKNRLPFNNDKLHGRSEEISTCTEIFKRVVETGQSEAIRLTGDAGCGKSALVQYSLFDFVHAAGGYVLAQKFDETSTKSCVSVVLAALNDLCGQVAIKLAQEERQEVFEKIRDTTDLPFISTVFKNISNIDVSDKESESRPSIISGLNYPRLVFAIMKLLTSIATPSHPVLFWLDDLQWADVQSLQLMLSVLSDEKGANRIMFVGSYRSAGIDEDADHFVASFWWQIQCCSIRIHRLNVDNLKESDVSALVADALGVLPRRCKSLAQLVHSKTKGNPFFAVQHRDLVERWWKWNVDLVNIQDVTDNVLQLITSKMSNLEQADKEILKVASCFGIKVKAAIVKVLSESSRFSGFALTRAVEQGFMERDGNNYKFVRDKVHEAARTTIDSDKERFTIADLNYKECERSLQCSDFSSAYHYAKKSTSLLSGTWSDRHRKCFYQMAQASFLCGLLDEANSCLDMIISNEHDIELKIDSYIFEAEISFLGRKALPQAFEEFKDVLGILGEVIPDKD
ncbi:hypothetical protein ACHAWO_006132 [Cyclotella atomus]|uniref:Orc1-like AAA ATPase domain-containing protein n=1 Tax=Cyclotella atomus TaxID=382360 RepID=A0ABD3MQB8_9STRA